MVIFVIEGTINNMCAGTFSHTPAALTNLPTERKKLALLPRTEPAQEAASTAVSTHETKAKASPFGAAKPVDTDSALRKIEERLAKEKEHKEESVTAKPGHDVSPSPSSPNIPRLDKGKGHGKQLLRRTSAPGSGPSSGGRETDPAVAGKTKTQDETVSESQETSWRKIESKSAPAPPVDEEPGWETVPARNKKVNGVTAKH